MLAIHALYTVHVTCAVLSISGFALRGCWMMAGNPRLQHRIARVLPHTVDTLLLASAVGMLIHWRLSPFDQPWIVAKLIALSLYIFLGMVALRFGKTVFIRAIAWLLALATAAYIVSVALTKNPWGILA